MKILVLGANGATGRLLVSQLLDRHQEVRAIVRSLEKLPETIRAHSGLTVVQATLLELDDAGISELVDDCDAIACCLGHNASIKGVFGPPYRLVTQATRRVCEAVMARRPDNPIRYLLMNTAVNSNRDIREQLSLTHQSLIRLMRVLLPPHVDNEQAADYLRNQIGQENDMLEWCAVRPDTLLDEETVSQYVVHPSPVRSAIFDPGKTSRINVAHFMADLLTDDALWNQWKGRMPVIYNRPEE